MNILNNANIIIIFKKDYGVYIKGNLTDTEINILNSFITDYKCKLKTKICLNTIKIEILGKHNIELLQNDEFKKLLFNPDFNVLENL